MRKAAMSTHTPGPWTYRGLDHGGRPMIATEDDRRGCYLLVALAEDVDGFSGNTLANARLIAQAPALREALRACLDAFDKIGKVLSVEECEKIAPFMEVEYDKARALLAQIEEERP